MSGRRKIQLDADLRREYETLFASATIRRDKIGVIDRTIERILRHKTRYEHIAGTNNVPWFLVAALHHMECNGDFGKHLHNGDPLSAQTVNKPSGRPPADVEMTWENSASDALRLKDLHKVANWTLSDIAFHAERYNGFGYRLYHPSVKSPYLWSFTSIYTTGKYVADRQFDYNAVSKQAGVLALLKRMLERRDIGPISGASLVSQAGLTAIAEGETVAADEFPPPDSGSTTTASASPRYPGRVIRRGDRGDEVKQVQRRLLELGLRDVGAVDGHFGPLTEAAVKLFQARSVNPSGFPLAVDGEVGPETWRVLFGGDSSQPPVGANAAVSDLIAEVLRIAEGEVGVRETPGAPNQGPRVDEYLARVDLKGEPWCVAFLYWCFDEAAKALRRSNPMEKTAGVWDHWNRARKRSNVVVVTAASARSDPSLIRPGMIFHFDTGAGKGHAGLVTDVLDGRRIGTVEGNTTAAGVRDGDGVYRRERDIRAIDMGFVGYV